MKTPGLLTLFILIMSHGLNALQAENFGTLTRDGEPLLQSKSQENILISARDMAPPGGNNFTYDMGTYRRGMNNLMQLPAIPLVSRSINDLWELTVDQDPLINHIDVQYEIYDEAGTQGFLSLRNYTNYKLPISLQALPNQIEELPMNTGDTQQQWRVTGGVNLVIDPSNSEFSGEYIGSIEITVNQI